MAEPINEGQTGARETGARETGARETGAPQAGARATAEGETGGGATEGSLSAPPTLWQWFLLYTLGRLAIAAVLIGLLWVLGLPGTPGFLFGVLLAMPVSLLVLSPVRKRLTSGLVARSEHKEALRAQLRGTDPEL